MKRITFFTLVAFCGAAIAANVPRSLIYGKTEAERRAEVFSAFVALGDTRGAEALPFLSSLAELTGEARRLSERRWDQAAPQVLEALAERSGLTPEAYRQALRDGRVPDPFDHSGHVIESPDFEHHGQDDGWFWGVWAPSKATESADQAQECGIWLVIWDDTGWFYAPMGTEDLTRIAQNATGHLLTVPFTDLPTCARDA